MNDAEEIDAWLKEFNPDTPAGDAIVALWLSGPNDAGVILKAFKIGTEYGKRLATPIVEIDAESSSAYVRVRHMANVAKTVEHSSTCNVDLDDKGNVIGVELLNVGDSVLPTAKAQTACG